MDFISNFDLIFTKFVCFTLYPSPLAQCYDLSHQYSDKIRNPLVLFKLLESTALLQKINYQLLDLLLEHSHPMICQSLT
jgi:hypothetical protein